MNQSFNVQFYCRASKAVKNGYAPLEMSININGTRKFIALPYKCLPQDFNRKKQPKELVDYMAATRKRINEILSILISEEIPLTVENLKQYIKNGGYKSYTVENLFDGFINILEKRIGTTITKSVFTKYLLVRDLFYTVISKDAECTTISPSHVKTFKAICESRYTTSTTGGYLTKLKSVLIFAFNNGKIKINPFVGTKICKGNKDIEYLTESELLHIGNLIIDNDSLRNARDCFLFECYSGISYCDIKNLDPKTIKEDNGTLYIQGQRQKTGKTFTSVLFPQAKNLLTFSPSGDVSGLNFRLISSQKINAYLHEIERLYGLKKKLTTHLGRHTYATILANKYRCRMEVVADALGDTLKITTKHYARFLSETTVNEIGEKFKQSV